MAVAQVVDMVAAAAAVAVVFKDRSLTIYMKKPILLVVLSFCMILTACGKGTEKDTSSAEQQSSQGQTKENVDTNPTVLPEKKESLDVTESDKNDFEYENALMEVIGENYLTGKALMRVDDEEIFGESCAVFKVGTNTEEKFTTEDWFAVNSNHIVYYYDIAMDEWSEYKRFNQEPIQIDRVEIDNCIYMLNEYLRDEFAVEYYDMPDYIKQAIFVEDAPSDLNMFDSLIGINEEIPGGYYFDPLARSYYPVYSHKNMNELLEHFNDYFTATYMEEIADRLSYEFAEFENTLYLVRGGRGYGSVMIDFDSVDYSNLEEDGTVAVDTLLFGEKDQIVIVEFDWSEGAAKINSLEFVALN